MDIAEPRNEAHPLRAELLRGFETWLDEALVDEKPPEGIAAEILDELHGDAPEEGLDLHALWSALTVLGQEAKLGGRASAQLREALAPVQEVGERIQGVLATCERAIEETRGDREELRREAARRTWREALDLLLDTRERVARGLAAARDALDRAAAASGWWTRLLGRRADGTREATEALVEGGRLALSRLDGALADLGVQEIRCEGLPFDPRRMKAVELGDAPGSPEGQVLTILRSGYEWRGELFRAAEVRVQRTRRTDREQ